MFQPSSGARNAKDTVARNISPIEDAMSASMQQAANDAARGGPAWNQLDQDWKAHSQVKRNLADTAGVLTTSTRRNHGRNTPLPTTSHPT